MMNITVGEYTIKRVPPSQTFIVKKGVTEAKFIADPPWPADLESTSHEEIYDKMKIAFETGKWPFDR